MMGWTSAADLHAQVQKLWDKGALLAQLVPAPGAAPRAPPLVSLLTHQLTPQLAAELFPLRLRLQGPSSSDLALRFDAARTWITALRSALLAPGWRIAWREVNHRVVGTNLVPEAVWLDSLDDALAVLGKHHAAQRFAALAEMTLAIYPALQPWLVKNTLKLLTLEAVWARLLATVAWIAAHPRPGIYLRQVSVPGADGVSMVDSKFIESHRVVLAELLDVVLPPDAIDPRFSGLSGFAARYGFQSKPLRIRFRVLDSALALIAPGLDQDITLTQAAFAELGDALQGAIPRVFFTENEVNFLAFPPLAGSLVIFGAGYGFEVLAGAAWLHQKAIHYWGDIDTHGFAILDQLRTHLPHVQSLLMDRDTLMAHREHWGEELQPTLRDLPRLDPLEQALFDDLRHNRWLLKSGVGLRLEQERIDFDWLQRALAALPITILMDKKCL